MFIDGHLHECVNATLIAEDSSHWLVTVLSVLLINSWLLMFSKIKQI